jgi:phage shock protein PspC (stress-responsive transcriptional regulator)
MLPGMENEQDSTRQAPPTPPRAPGAKRLVRLPKRGPLGGVCAGVAKYFDLDPTIVRIATVILAFMGPAVPAYLIAWVFVPADDGTTIAASVTPHGARHDRGTQVFGIILLVVAVSILWGDWWSPARHWMVPLGLIGLGAWLLLRRDDGGDDPVTLPPPRPTDGTPPPAPPSPIAAPASPIESAPVLDPAPPTPPDGEGSDEPGEGDGELDPTEIAAGGPPPIAWTAGDAAAEPDPMAAGRRRRRRLLGPVVFGGLLLWGGIAVLAGIDVEAALAIALCIVGVGFVLGAFIGGSWALVFPAVLIGGALVAASVIDIPLEGGVGNKNWTPSSTSEVRDDYQLAIGDGVLDLRDIQVPRGDELDVEVQLGIGHLKVYVPEDTTIDIESEVGAGQSDLLGRSDEGMGVDADRTVTGSSAKGSIHLDVEVGIGHLEVVEMAPSPRLR